jgi:hypothetical protein
MIGCLTRSNGVQNKVFTEWIFPNECYEKKHWQMKKKILLGTDMVAKPPKWNKSIIF